MIVSATNPTDLTVAAPKPVPNEQKASSTFSDVKEALEMPQDDIPAPDEVTARIASFRDKMSGDLVQDGGALGAALRVAETPDGLFGIVTAFIDPPALSVKETFQMFMNEMRLGANPLVDQLDRVKTALREVSKARQDYEDPAMVKAAIEVEQELKMKIAELKEQIEMQATIKELQKTARTEDQEWRWASS